MLHYLLYGAGKAVGVAAQPIYGYRIGRVVYFYAVFIQAREAHDVALVAEDHLFVVVAFQFEIGICKTPDNVLLLAVKRVIDINPLFDVAEKRMHQAENQQKNDEKFQVACQQQVFQSYLVVRRSAEIKTGYIDKACNNAKHQY
jgi:hypothetical protein